MVFQQGVNAPAAATTANVAKYGIGWEINWKNKLAHLENTVFACQFMTGVCGVIDVCEYVVYAFATSYLAVCRAPFGDVYE